MASAGEHPHQLRPMICTHGLLSQPDGSALFNQGDTSVIAAVYGPTETRFNRERIDRATVEVSFMPKIGQPGCAEKTVERTIRAAVESAVITTLHPRTTFSIIVQELHDAGSLLVCCINAVCAALLDACAPMRFTIAAVHCAVVDADGTIVLDPTEKQVVNAIATATFVFDSKTETVLSSVSSGRLSDVHFQTCLAVCRQASRQIFDFHRETYAKRAEACRLIS